MNVIVGQKRKKRPAFKNLYIEGGGGDRFVEGHSDGSGSVSKEADHLACEVSGNSTSQATRTWVTDEAVDLTDYATVRIDWEGTSASESPRARLCVSTNKTGDSDTFDVRKNVDAMFDRITESLDVSGLTGDHFIRVHVVDIQTLSDTPGSLKTYRIRLKR